MSCREASCADGVQTFAANCDGSGVCPVAQSKACAPYVCLDDVACAAKCTSDLGCEKSSCNLSTGECVAGAKCDGKHTVTGIDGSKQDCTPFLCNANGTCKTTCQSVADCAAGHVCDSAAVCVPAGSGASGAGDDGGCGCRAAGGAPNAGLLGWLVAIGLAARRRRRA